MTTYSKRRGRRSLAAILAAMLMASVLAVVAGSPAQAANTASEVLVDDAREFAGQDRYDTALRLAKNFATSKGGLGAVPAAFIASGETLVDSISVAGLAGYVDAPILLTPTGSLHGGVADFIEDYDVKTVYVLGGSAAVSDATVTAIESQASKPKATRIAGDDRYATAAKIAGMIDAESSWCGTDAVSAVLINGGSDALSFGVAVQTTAYRLQLPVLMTAADELPDATADFIRDNDVEHVQIVGGAGTVSADVAAALTTLGVDTVQRVDGDSAAAASVALAKMANNGCGDDLAPVSTNRVALVRGNPDGVVAAPVLASSLANGELVTPLIVGDSLPASVRDYLTATPKVVSGTKLALGIVAIGGTAAVSDSTMSAAIEAAASAGALSVSIGATTDVNMDGKIDADDPVRPGTAFSLYFSDDVAGTDAELLAKVRDIVEVNDAVAQVAAATTATITGVCTPRRVDVTLTKALTNGDTLSVASSVHTFGTQSDQRRLAPVTPEKVVAAPADTTRPKVTIIGIANEAAFQIRISDAGGLDSDAKITLDELTFTSGKGTASLATGAVTHTAGETTATVTVTREADAGGNAAANTLVVGDRLTIKSGAIADTSENVNSSTTGRAIAEPKSPRITSVLLSNPLYSAQNVWTVPDSVGATGDNAITITAKASGDAAGAAGNAWSVVFDTPSTYSAEKASDIDVRVDTKGKTVTVRFVNGPATVGSLLAALKANSAFDERFSAGTGCSAVATTALTPSNAADDRDAAAEATRAGRTQFAIEVRFGSYIATHVDDELLADVLARTLARNRNNEDADTQSELIALLGTGAGTGTLVGTAPGKTVRYEMETASTAYMPMDRDRVLTLAGAEAAADADANKAGDQARALVAHVATGYAPDDPNEPADESKNGKSDLRISQTSSIKARNP
ncbi:MAG: cell wall-binding repeat-containing protein [Acidimicrobiaceae bacterium]|nr:cell wall-binding repeat-containing protein [Acidimicrobiaceae bacterium]